jgi:cytochrome P450
LFENWSEDFANVILFVVSLAYAEMRLILAKLLFSFDLELVDKERQWMRDQKVFTLWDKPSLMVRLKAVER